MFGFLCVLLVLSCSAEEFFREDFPSKEAINDWIVTNHHNEETKGEWSISQSKHWKDSSMLGLKTEKDARFYGISKKIPTPFSNNGKSLVVQFIVKYEETVTCGGAYIKLLGAGTDQTAFHGDTPYLLMFGPDICGYSTKKVHVIFNYKGNNLLIKQDIRCKDDLLSHLYTLILTPDNKYKVLIDNEEVQQGSLEDDWDMLLPKKIDDPAAKKPEDWVDEADIDDPEDKKPEDWDHPKMITDPNAKKPEDWDDSMDGDWEAPQIDNPDYKGEWSSKKIPNPAFKGVWEPPVIDNPEYKPDDELYVLGDMHYVGFDLWQVTSKSIFDGILITDDVEYAKAEGERVWKPRFEAESESIKEEEKKAEEESKSKADTAEQNDDEEDKENEDESTEDEPTGSTEESKHEEL